ncbi:glycosyltransferase family 2 protein, partial [bacterium]|nr:glycosyltransferase family 2 protein [bacterium]
ETIQSVSNQTHPVDEILVIDDGSTDDSATVARSASPKVRVIRQDNAGESAARNRGIDESSGDLLAFIDADDIWEPDKIARQVNTMKDEECIGCCTGFYNFGSMEEEKVSRTQITDGISVEQFLIGFETNMSTPLVFKKNCPQFAENVSHGEDTLFLMDIACLGKLAYVPAPLVGYRRHQGGQSNSRVVPFNRYLSKRQWIDENTLFSPEVKAEHHRTNDQTFIDFLHGSYYAGRVEQYLALSRECVGKELPQAVLAAASKSALALKLRKLLSKTFRTAKQDR